MKSMKQSIIYGFFLTSFLTVSCSSENGVKSKKESNVTESSKTGEAKDSLETIISSENKKIEKTKIFDNGIAISWIERGEGPLIKDDEVVNIDFKVSLKNGKVIDGNHLWKKETFPFMVGYQMQTKGWDFALKHLKVGDFVTIKIPSKLARGEQGIKQQGEKEWFVPPNSDNFVTLRVVSRMEPTRVVDGNKVWVFEESKKSKIAFSENNAIQFHSMISTKSNPFYYNSYRENDPYTLYITDKGIVPGLKKSLIKAKKGDRILVLLPASEAYGAKGLEGMVQPNENLFYNILVMDVLDK